jgi:5-methyltetrahydropteroyltriglutamate--homocysteine methyltransferase
MQRSTERVLTSHVGSLPRPDELTKLHTARQTGQIIDEAVFEDRVRAAVDDAVKRQVEAGVDVVSDGEMSKNSYLDYTSLRVSGFEVGESVAHSFFGDLEPVPEIAASIFKDTRLTIPICEGPLKYTGFKQVQRDIQNLRAAMTKYKPTDAFISSASPGIVAMCSPNKYYSSYDEYVFAVADVMHSEYKAITDAGLNVQIDAPDTALGADLHTWMWDEIEKRGFEKILALHVEAINRALNGISPDRVRIHLCWANYFGPHTHDYPLPKILQHVFKANVGAISFEAANPAHAHEWELFRDLKVPDGKILLPGVIDTKTHVVESPQAVAHRIIQFANLAGQENVIASSDCGFMTFIGLGTVHPYCAWLKLKALGDGAAIATRELTKGGATRRAIR